MTAREEAGPAPVWAKLTRVWLLGGAGFVALVIFLSLTPDPLDAPTVSGVKTGHVLAYFWLMLWFSQVWEATRSRLKVALGLVLLGVGLEYVQRLTGYRTFSYADMRDDAIGVAAGLLVANTVLGHALTWLERFYLRMMSRRMR